jgi:hypothetical protein
VLPDPITWRLFAGVTDAAVCFLPWETCEKIRVARAVLAQAL